MNIHIKPATKDDPAGAKARDDAWDDLSLKIGHAARKAQATATLWAGFLRTLKRTAEGPNVWSAAFFLDAMKREISLIDAYVDELDNEMADINEEYWRLEA